MKRRDFLSASLAASTVGTLASALESSAAESAAGPHEFYELRQYHLRTGPQQKRFNDFYQQAAIPALTRAGIEYRWALFNVQFGPGTPAMYVLIPHNSLESFGTSNDRVRSDPDYRKLGADFINAPATDPSYVRVESALLRAFTGVPKIEVPAAAAGNKPRLFELRTYESHSKKANDKKIEMFNSGSELAIFRRAGLQPVFFGETLIGGQMPNLTYLLAHENMAAREKNWAAFAADPAWQKLSTTPGYTDRPRSFATSARFVPSPGGVFPDLEPRASRHPPPNLRRRNSLSSMKGRRGLGERR